MKKDLQGELIIKKIKSYIYRWEYKKTFVKKSIKTKL